MGPLPPATFLAFDFLLAARRISPSKSVAKKTQKIIKKEKLGKNPDKVVAQ